MSQTDTNVPTARSSPIWGPMSLASLLEKQAASRRKETFITTQREKTISFGELQQRVVTLAGFLTESGFGPGDCLLLRLGRRWEGLIALLAAARSGLDVCLVPEGMSARDVGEGAGALTPKIVIDVRADKTAGAFANRAMEIAAGLFTVKMVGTFGDASDGMVDLSNLPQAPSEPVEDPESLDPATTNPEAHALLHRLQTGATGRLERLTRTQGAILSQGLACAMAMRVVRKTTIGSAFDPLGTTGLFSVFIPALLTGCQVRQFNPLDPLVGDDLRRWALSDFSAVGVLPLALADGTASVDPKSVKRPGRQVWTVSAFDASSVNMQAMGAHEVLLLDMGGIAILPARTTMPARGDENTPVTLMPGALTIDAISGEPMLFGELSLAGGLHENGKGQDNSSALMSGEITIKGALAAHRETQSQSAQRTGVFARLVDGEQNGETGAQGTAEQAGSPRSAGPVYALSGVLDTAGVTGTANPMVASVGGQLVSIATINRCLSLTGRWQDAAAYLVKDSVLGHRVEVALVPREENPDAEGAQHAMLPGLDDVRMMLCESGIADTALPVKCHLVNEIVRSASGQLVTSALTPHPLSRQVRDGDEKSTDQQAA